MKTAKYTLFIMVILLVIVISKLLDASAVFTFVLFILGIDIAVFAALAFQEKLPKLDKKHSAMYSKYESPTSWLKICVLSLLFSTMAGGVYSIFHIFGVQTDAPIISNNSLLWYTIVFCLFGWMYIFRFLYFRLNPSSKANIIVGKLIHHILEILVRVAILSVMAFFQVINGLMLYFIITGAILQNVYPTPFGILYACAIIVSFVGMVPIVHAAIFRLKEKISRRGWISIIAFSSPWILFFSVGIWAIIGTLF